MSKQTMGQQLARAIFERGRFRGQPATRIQFKAGKWPDRETDLGGLCEDAFANLIDGWIKETVRHPPEETI